ncbi:MAG TPA: acyltransferase [Longimicrobiaceae bacterium]|nr:acyltransferase [Longimicrobiaceae bacterium]
MQPSTPGARRSRLPALTGIRFFAAMHVLLLHSLQARWLPGPVRSAVEAGYTSTSLLFILSGFVLVWVYTTPEGGFRGSRPAFWTARVARVYPLTVLSHLLVIPVWVGWNGTRDLWTHAAVALSAQQGWIPPLVNVLNSPAWAVTFLFFAYALFPWMAERVRALPERALVPAMAAAWALCVLPGVYVLLAMEGVAGRTVLYTFPLLRLPEFVFGVLLGRWFLLRGALPARTAARVAAASLGVWAAVILAGGGIPRELLHNGLLAPLQGLLVVALASGGGAVGRFLSTRPLRTLGEAGLAVFLLHVPVLAWFHAAGWIPGPSLLASTAAYVAYVAATLALSLAAMRWVVDPVAARARRWTAPAPAPEPPPMRLTAV